MVLSYSPGGILQRNHRTFLDEIFSINTQNVDAGLTIYHPLLTSYFLQINQVQRTSSENRFLLRFQEKGFPYSASVFLASSNTWLLRLQVKQYFCRHFLTWKCLFFNFSERSNTWVEACDCARGTLKRASVT